MNKNGDWKAIADQVLWIVRAMEMWRDNPSRAFDEVASRFFDETGMIAPGKDCPEWFGHPEDERRKRFDHWSKEKHEQRLVILRMAAEALAEGEVLRRSLRKVCETAFPEALSNGEIGHAQVRQARGTD